MTPFDYVKKINTKKDNILTEEEMSQIESDFVPFVVLRAFSYFPDTCLQANEMNLRSSSRHNLSKKMIYDYLNNSIDKSNRFSKWEKPIKDDSIELIKRVYGYTTKKAIEVVKFFSENDLEELKRKVDDGGVK